MGVFDFFKSKEYHITTDKLDEEQLSTHRESSGLTMSESALSERGLLLAKHLDEKAQTDSPKKGLTPEQLKKVVEILKMRLKGKGIVPKTSKPMQEKEYTCPIFNAKFVLIPAGTNDENELGDYA